MSSLKLWPEQQAVYKDVIGLKEAALFCEQRTGKTYLTLKIWETLVDQEEEFHGLMITLLTNKESTWLDAVRRFLPQINVTDDWEEYKKLPSPRLLIIHYEMFVKLINRLCKYKKINWCGFDEAQRISNRGNKASRGASRMSWVDRKVIMTGTPQEVRETDYFGLFRFLVPELFGTNWAKFEKRFMEWPLVDMSNAPPGSAMWQQKVLQQRILKNKAQFREEKREEFIELLAPYCARLTKEDVGIKQALVHKVTVPMSSAQRSVYVSMKRDSFAYLPSRKKRSQKRVTAALTITNIAKLRQIATGFIYDDDNRLHDLSDVKMKETLRLIEELPKPVVVFTAFRPDNDLVYETLVEEGYDVVQVNGSTKKKLRPQIWRDFQRAQYDVAVVQTKTGGTGVDLWKAGAAIVYSMTHSYRDWDQLKARLDSRDKKQPSEFFVLCSKNSIDEDLFDLVVVKKFNTELTLQHLKRGFKDGQGKIKNTRKRNRKSSTGKGRTKVRRR